MYRLNKRDLSDPVNPVVLASKPISAAGDLNVTLSDILMKEETSFCIINGMVTLHKQGSLLWLQN